jgi:hypothetical protein
MKLKRLLLALALLGLFACTSPTSPRYPQDGENKGDDGENPKEGLLLTDPLIYWA